MDRDIALFWKVGGRIRLPDYFVLGDCVLWLGRGGVLDCSDPKATSSMRSYS